MKRFVSGALPMLAAAAMTAQAAADDTPPTSLTATLVGPSQISTLGSTRGPFVSRIGVSAADNVALESMGTRLTLDGEPLESPMTGLFLEPTSNQSYVIGPFANPGTLSIEVFARDASGNEARLVLSDEVAIVATEQRDLAAPAMLSAAFTSDTQINTPGSITGPFTTSIDISAADDVALQFVGTRIYRDGELVASPQTGISPEPSWKQTYTVGPFDDPGSLVVQVFARDTAGNESTLTLDGGIGVAAIAELDTVPPSGLSAHLLGANELTFAEGENGPFTTEIEVSAVDDVALRFAGARVYRDGVLVDSRQTGFLPQVTCNRILTLGPFADPGAYSVEVYARDAAGNETTAMLDAEITVGEAFDMLAPTIDNVSFVGPTAIFASSLETGPMTTKIQVLASDDASMKAVEFRVFSGETLIASGSREGLLPVFNETLTLGPFVESGTFAVEIAVIDGALHETVRRLDEPLIVRGQSLFADFSGDGRVGFEDFFAFADHFGETGFPEYDLNGDSDIDFEDFFLLADVFGTTIATQ